MYDEIVEKLYRNLGCDLSIEELKILYEIDETAPDFLQYYRFFRNRETVYNDFVKIFGEEYVEYDVNNITVKTIAYVPLNKFSNFIINNNDIPTYNLRFIYSNCTYIPLMYKYITKLENLEIIYGDLNIGFVCNIDGLENLRKITGTFSLDYSYDSLDLCNIDYVNTLILRWPLLPMKRINAKNIIFPKHVEHLTFKDNIKKYNSFILPKGLRTIFVPNLNILNRCIINDNIDVYTTNNKLVSPLELRLHAKVISDDSYYALVKQDIKRVINKYKDDLSDRRNKTKIR